MDRPHLFVEQTVNNAAPNAAVPALLLATGCGVVAANLYCLQPLAALVAASVGLPPGWIGLVATMTQLGYGLGLVLVVPLADLIENRRLVAITMGLSVAALLLAALAPNAAMLLAAVLLVGIGAVAVQLIVIYAVYLINEAQRGRVIGLVTSGLMLGIMLSRPVAGAISQCASWRLVPMLAAAATTAMALRLWCVLPIRRPPAAGSYRGILASLPRLFRDTPVLRLRTGLHAALFFGFGTFWTVIPLVLHERFGLSQGGIALFSLTGIASVLAAPVAGRVADRGQGLVGTILSIGAVSIGFGLAAAPPSSSSGPMLLGLASVLIGAGVTGHAVFAQRDVLGLEPRLRARANGSFMAAYFAAGAAGAAVGGWIYATHGWPWTCVSGVAAAAVAMLLFAARSRAGHPVSS